MRFIGCVLLVVLLQLTTTVSAAQQTSTRNSRATLSFLHTVTDKPSQKAHTVIADLRTGDSHAKGSQLLLQLRGGGLHPTTWSLTTTKIILQLALVGFNILCWSLPLRNAVFQSNERLLSLANSFAGGIFLMLSFGHLIPHILQESSAVSGYGILYYVVAGFLAMLFVEKVAFGHDDHDHDCSSHSSTSIKPEFNPSTPKASLCGLKQKLSGSQTVVKTESSPTVAVRRPWFKVNSAQILCFAMGIHSFFESAALGISDSKTTAVLMAASIALHQPAESLALVIAFLKHCNTSDNSKANHHNKMSKRSIILWLLGFSSIALFGNLAGSLIRRVASEEVESIVMALTAGTFIYVGASEIVNEEFEAKDFQTKFVNFLTYVGGMVSMTLVTNVVDNWEKQIGHH